MKINKEYLEGLGFRSFYEDGVLMFYQKFTKTGGIISFIPPQQDFIMNLTDWTLSIKSRNFELKCTCETSEKYMDIIRFFGIKAESDTEVKMDRDKAQAFIQANGLILPKCRRCSQYNYCDDNCARAADAELLQYVMEGKITESNIKEFQ